MLHLNETGVLNAPEFAYVSAADNGLERSLKAVLPIGRGVLFVDEAHHLIDSEIDILRKEMQARGRNLVVVLSGSARYTGTHASRCVCGLRVSYTSCREA